MKSIRFVLAGLIAGLLTTPLAWAQKTGVRGVTRTSFSEWTNSLSLESSDAAPKAVVVPAIGGRVMSYGLQGQNLLWVNPSSAGRTLASAGGPFEPGGFQCDIGPEVLGLAAHPDLWLGPYEAIPKKNYRVAFHTLKDEALHLELEKEIVFDPATGDLGFVHKMKNIGDRDSAYCFWHRIACRPGGWVLIPLNPKSRFSAGWSQRHEGAGRAAYDGSHPDVPAVRILDGVLVAKTGASPARIGVDSDAQWTAYALGRTLFIVHYPVYSSATYSEGGNTVTVDWDETRTELQPLSPEARLRPRRTYDFPLKWSVLELAAEVTTAEEARTLVAKVPGSPFL